MKILWKKNHELFLKLSLVIWQEIKPEHKTVWPKSPDVFIECRYCANEFHPHGKFHLILQGSKSAPSRNGNIIGVAD